MSLIATAIQVPLTNPATPGYPAGGKGINVLVSNVIGAATMVAGILLIGYLVYGAITYISAGGDEKAIDSAKKMITNAIIGLLLVVLATTIAAIVGAVLGVPVLTPPWNLLRPGGAT